jgi:hypothetical protein
VQRLFSTFPRSAPGVALVLLRVAVAATLYGAPLAYGQEARPWLWFGTIIIAACLCIGLLTPPMALIAAVMEGASLFDIEHAPALAIVITIATALSLALLGPGGYSIDAWLFGRRVFVVSSGASTPDTLLRSGTQHTIASRSSSRETRHESSGNES